MIDCSELSGRMPDVIAGRSEWSAEEARHLTECDVCAAEWRLVRIGSVLYAGREVATERMVQDVLVRLRAGEPVALVPRLSWRKFAMGLAAAASVALAVWVPNRAHQSAVMALPARLGPVLPNLSNVTDEQLYRISLANAGHLADGVPGTVPHLGGLTAADLEQLSSLTETR